MAFSFSAMSAEIVGIGQVGDKYIYKINGVLVSLGAGAIVAGCEVRAGSGLRCDDSYLNIDNNKSALETLEEKIAKMKKLENMHNITTDLENQISDLSGKNSDLIQENEHLNSEIESLKQGIVKRNSTINRLSSILNSKN